MFPLRLPHLPGEQIREVKMIPRSMWRQRANSSSTKNKEKESKRWALGKIEERNKPSPLPRAYLPCRRNKQRRMQTVQLSFRIPNQFKIKAVESQQYHLSPKPDLRS
ncbi:hypothetical protein ACFX2J_022141 [Malus domestica]